MSHKRLNRFGAKELFVPAVCVQTSATVAQEAPLCVFELLYKEDLSQVGLLSEKQVSQYQRTLSQNEV